MAQRSGEFYGFYDVQEDIVPNDRYDVEPSTGWLTLFENQTLGVFKQKTKDGRRQECIAPHMEDKLRIAILDTGVDMSHPEISAQKARIKKRKAWVQASTHKLQAEDEDVHGHGTHATALLLRLVPHADIYFARVSSKDGPEPSAVAEAIRYAHQQWKVDIISMAFGFPRGGKGETKAYRDALDAIDNAITEAAVSRVLMFGAACNMGDLNTTAIAFPARHQQVICIHSATAFGKRSYFTPLGSPKSYNFSILGENVLSAWPQLQKRKPMSGTSTAVTIAAAVSGIVLYLVRLRDEKFDIETATLDAVRRCLRRRDAMCEILEQMSDYSEGYRFIKPWNLIDKDYTNYREIDATRREIVGQIANILRRAGFTIP